VPATTADRPAPAHPFDQFLTAALPAARTRRPWTPDDGPLPALYLGHGAPPLFEDELWMSQLFGWAQGLPVPRAVLIVSAHWESAPLSLSAAAAGTPLVHDFGGFDRRYFQMTYPTPDASALAAAVAAAMPDGETVHEHGSRGLDHGAWVPLKVMYPVADVPVLQLSIPTHDPARLLDLGRRLRPLRDQGVLVVGSGFLTHGLPFLRREHFTGAAPAPSWSRDFDAWAGEALGRGDVDELAAYRDRAPGMPYAHPTVEHYSPLFVTLGAAERPDAPVTTTVDGFAMGLAKRSFQVA
jgi:4,5-DOPA dioxygenase extradiol